MMDWNLFKEKIKIKQYDELEKELKNKKKDDSIAKYQLGIVYSHQDKKIKTAIDIFKELLEENFNKPFIYIFLSEYAFDYKEKINTIKCGISLYPKNIILNRLLLEITTDSDEVKKIYSTLESKNSLINYDNLKMAEIYYKNYNYKETINNLDKINLEKQNNYTNNQIILLKNTCAYYLNDSIKLEDIKKYTIGNLKEEFGYLGFYLEIAYYLKKQDYKKVNEIIENLPYNMFSDVFFEVFTNDGRYPCYFEFENFFNEINSIISKLENIDIQSINKIETIKIIYKLKYDFEETKLTKKEIKDYLKIIKLEFTQSKEECLVEVYFDLLMKNNNQEKAIKFLFENYLYSFRCNKIIDLDNYKFSQIAINLLYSKIVSRNSNLELNKKEKKLIELLMKLLYLNKEYKKVCIISEMYNKKVDFEKNNILFNIAYSYVEIEKFEIAEKIYLKLLKKDKNNSAILNNLGIIYERKGEINKALEYLEKAESISHDDTHVRNIKRCNSTIEEKKKNQEEILEGKENIKRENVFIINKYESFVKYKNESGDIICSYNELPTFLNINPEKSKEVLDIFLKKKYLFKLNQHSYETPKSVYKVNCLVEEEIINIRNNNKLMNEMIDKINKISLDKMDNMNLNNKFDKLNNINNLEISSILKRDYFELFESYILNNQKSVTILSGSIIETILIYIIKEHDNNIENKLYEYDLTKLLNICENNNYISSVPLNFINGLKKYRNFVHPGVEIRENKRNIKIGDESTNLLWDFVNWLIDYAI